LKHPKYRKKIIAGLGKGKRYLLEFQQQLEECRKTIIPPGLLEKLYLLEFQHLLECRKKISGPRKANLLEFQHPLECRKKIFQAPTTKAKSARISPSTRMQKKVFQAPTTKAKSICSHYSTIQNAEINYFVPSETAFV
jgi:hypothetical protein